MQPPNEEYHTSAMVDAVRDMTRKLEQFQRHADDARKTQRNELLNLIESLRKDVYRAISALQLDSSQHRDEHAADRQRQAADAIERINRQLTWNVWMGALTVLVVINLLLLGFVVVRVVIASGGL